MNKSMYGYKYVLVSQGLDNQPRSPYRFEPGEPDDQTRATGKYGVISAIAAYALVIAIVIALSFIVGTDQPGSTEQARRPTSCVHATDVWSGCLPSK